jgi:hypothetical protein
VLIDSPSYHRDEPETRPGSSVPQKARPMGEKVCFGLEKLSTRRSRDEGTERTIYNVAKDRLSSATFGLRPMSMMFTGNVTSMISVGARGMANSHYHAPASPLNFGGKDVGSGRLDSWVRAPLVRILSGRFRYSSSRRFSSSYGIAKTLSDKRVKASYSGEVWWSTITIFHCTA